MAGVKFTENQQNCINASNGCILVSAAAGSGKTAVLTERVIRLLTGDNPIDADRLVIVTFTIAAADEMRQRINTRLSELIELDPTNQLLQIQQLLLSKAKISTIHSLCSSIVKDNFQKLALSSDFRIADSVELEIIKRDAVNDILEKCYEDESQDFLELVEDWRKKNDNPLAELILSVYDFIRSFAFPKDFLKQSIKMYQDISSFTDSIWYSNVKEHLCDALSYAIGILNKAIDEMQSDTIVAEKYQEAFVSDIEQFNQILEQLNLNEWDSAVISANNAKSFKAKLKAVTKYEDKAFLEKLQDYRATAYKILAKLSEKYLCCTNDEFISDTHLLIPRITTLFGLVEQVYDLIDEKKLEKSVIDFDDLEHFTVNLLVEKTDNGYVKSDTAIALSNEIDEIMIDECQDINEVQDLIFRMLSQNEENLFMVGDVKQSIYRFRKAMPSLFINRKNIFQRYSADCDNVELGSLITLEKNFRSRTDVCSTVNFIFSQIMSSEIGEIDYNDEEYLVPAASYTSIEEVQAEVHLVEYSDDDNDTTKTQVEARHIGHEIDKMIYNGYPVQDKDGTIRKCEYRDFAILVRAKKGKSSVIEQELKEMNIPCFADSSDGYFDEYEIAVIINLLRIIDNPLLDVPLLSVLMSPMFGFDADAITQIRICDTPDSKNIPMYLCVKKSADNCDIRCAEFIDIISKLRTKSAAINVDELIQEIYDITDYIALSYATGNGEQKDANLRLLLIYAKQYENIGSYGLSGFLRYIDRVIENKQDFICANVASEHSNTVRIMSIHSSKGLEFPICFVADCAKQFNRSELNQSYQFNSMLGFGMKIKEPVLLKSYSNLAYEAIKLKTEKEAISEEMRVLYVALTRAKEKLIMLITMDKPNEKIAKLCSMLNGTSKPYHYEVYSASSYAEWIIPSVICHCGAAELRNRSGLNDIHLMDSDFKVECKIISPDIEQNNICIETISPASPDEQIVDRLNNRFNFKYEYEQMTKIPAKLTATQMAKEKQISAVKLDISPLFMRDDFSLNLGSLTPAQRGTALHSFMQFADFSNAKLDLSSEINRLIDSRFITRIEAESLDTNKISLFLKSDLYRRMKESTKLFREYKFLYFLPVGDINNLAEDTTEEILMQGIADCVFIEADGLVIVDYKTDLTSDESVLIERYAGQLDIYKRAIEQAFSASYNLHVKECLIYSLHMQKSIVV